MDGIAEYQFVRLVEEANYGDYYLARAPAKLNLAAEYVLVKVFPGSGDAATYRRATRELRHFALAYCETLVPIYDAGQQNGTFYYSMEYLEMGSLRSPARPLTRADTLAAVADAADAAHALHENGIVHRDIKPANVMLRPGGGKLSDLGLSQVLAPGMVFTGMGQLGLEFTDPAILLGGEASRATDIWSLGATLHKVLTGKSVYGELPSTEPLLLVRAILAAEARPDPSLDPQAAAFVASCLHADATQRPPTAAEVATQIRALS